MTQRIQNSPEPVMRSPSLILAGSGLVLTAVSCLHMTAMGRSWDFFVFHFLHVRLHRCARFFGYLWPLGTTPVTLLLLWMIYAMGLETGLPATLIFFGSAAIERIVKLTAQRRRPFDQFPDVEVVQPVRPHDPAYPSGDAMRVWFLAIVIPSSFDLAWPAALMAGIIATLLSIGRVVLGVHFPLDVIGGAGLGMLGAGLFFICCPDAGSVLFF
jgi:undecaprenyl-diphosphatase